ncbi:MAG: hypothetical protein ACRETT_15555, partial [Steroidobacteraceae bacterium]
MSHGDEVVLPADAAHPAAVRERIGHGRTEQRHHHRRVDEAGVPALEHAQLAIRAKELIDVAD